MALGVQISSFFYPGAPTLSKVFGYFGASSGAQIQRIQISALVAPAGGNIKVTLVDVMGNSLGVTATLANGTAYVDYPLPTTINLVAGNGVRAQITDVDNGTAEDLTVSLIGATSQGPVAPSSGGGSCGCGNTQSGCVPPVGTMLFFQGSVQDEAAQAAASAAAAASSASAASTSQTAAAASVTSAAASATAAGSSASSAGTSATTATLQAGNAAASAAAAGVSATNANASAVAAAASAAAAAIDVETAYKDACVAQLTAGSTQTIADATPTAVAWDSVLFDDNSFWSNANPTRLTVPAGVNRVRLSAGIRWDANSTGERKIQIRFNPAGTYEANGIWASDDRPSDDTGDATVVTPIIPVAAGDYFEVIVTQDSGGGLDLNTSTAAINRGNFFAIETIRSS